MNLISSSCISGYIYRKLNMRYMNPFVWGGIDFENFIKLIENYDTIDYWNRNIYYDKKFFIDNEPVLNIDNNVNVVFNHYYKNDKYDIPTKIYGDENIDIAYKDIDSYILDNYDRRLNRMIGEPIFIYDDWDFLTHNNNIKNLFSIDTNYKIVIATFDKSLKELETDNIKVVIKSSETDNNYEDINITADKIIEIL